MKRMNKVPEAGANAQASVAHVGDLMTSPVITVTRHKSIEHAAELMARHGIHALPVVTSEGEAAGIITSTDLLGGAAGETLIGQVMAPEVLTVTQYSGLHTAARMMRKHHIHHLVVTHEQKVVGMLSSFDLLRLVEDRRFVMKKQPTRTQKGRGSRAKREDPIED